MWSLYLIDFYPAPYSDIDRVCRIIVYSIDASNPLKASIKLVGRLPLDRSKNKKDKQTIKPDSNIYFLVETPLPVLLFPLPCYQESFMVVTVI